MEDDQAFSLEVNIPDMTQDGDVMPDFDTDNEAFSASQSQLDWEKTGAPRGPTGKELASSDLGVKALKRLQPVLTLFMEDVC
jgi:hypothetical protein